MTRTVSHPPRFLAFDQGAESGRLIAGPVEAAALGNIIGQAVATGHLSWEEGRTFVRRTENPARYSPADGAAWEEAYVRFSGLGDLSRGGIPD